MHVNPRFEKQENTQYSYKSNIKSVLSKIKGERIKRMNSISKAS